MLLTLTARLPSTGWCAHLVCPAVTLPGNGETRHGPLYTIPYTVELNDIAVMLVQHHKAADAPARFCFTWRWEQEDGSLGEEMRIDTAFLDRNDGTDMVFNQTRFPTDESREQHEGGWTGSFESLAAAPDDLIQDR